MLNWPPDRSTILLCLCIGAVVMWSVLTILGFKPGEGLLGFAISGLGLWLAMPGTKRPLDPRKYDPTDSPTDDSTTGDES